MTSIPLLQHNNHSWLKHINLSKKHQDDAGWDMISPFSYTIKPICSQIIPTGLHVNIPSGLVGLVKSRSSLALNYDIECSNAGVIDSGYHGEILVKLYNHHPSREYKVQKGDRIAQLLIVPCMTSRTPYCSISQQVIECDIKYWKETDRGQAGVGSTGR